ncbi:hypothetical protein DYB25_011149 [Aphanomyces astaci]|uniref:Uncharacterized protein n=1 Tax=Aphanomyces astaci TaxID=112090 RepID=A0A397BMN0_APHAT|nr:hypothetical protein DYB25_011149 [Aphanomyces astaci]
MPAALQRVNEEVESLGDALKQAREEWEAEIALRKKVEQERDQANTERDKLEERYKDLATRVENAIQARLSSMADQVRELDRQQRSYEEEVAEVEERYQVEVAAHRDASRALATATQRFPDVVPAFWDWVSAHFRVTSGPVFDRLLEAWVRDDPAIFEDNCENLSVFAFPTRQPPSTRARGRILGVSYDNWSAVLARDQRSHSLAVPTLPTPTSPSATASYQGSPGPTRTMTLALRSFWQKYAHSIWNRSFMTSSGAAEREIEALMGPLLGIAGSLFRVVQAYGVQLQRFLCYPHSYWPEFLREGVSLRNLITLHGGQAVADYVQTQGPE